MAYQLDIVGSDLPTSHPGLFLVYFKILNHLVKEYQPSQSFQKIYAGSILVDMKLMFIYKTKILNNNCDIIIMDRYIPDALVDFCYVLKTIQ